MGPFVYVGERTETSIESTIETTIRRGNCVLTCCSAPWIRREARFECDPWPCRRSFQRCWELSQLFHSCILDDLWRRSVTIAARGVTSKQRLYFSWYTRSTRNLSSSPGNCSGLLFRQKRKWAICEHGFSTLEWKTNTYRYICPGTNCSYSWRGPAWFGHEDEAWTRTVRLLF